ncbi:MAG: MerR family transcriptional regulator [Pseudomonadota bacterium]
MATGATDRSTNKAPDAFRTISEASSALGVPQHVLRFWETKFGQIRPLKRAGGRRYYRPSDLDLLRGVRVLLYDEGYTIKGVQKLFRDQGARYVSDFGRRAGEEEAAAARDALAEDPSPAAPGRAAVPVEAETPVKEAALGSAPREEESAAPDDDASAAPALGAAEKARLSATLARLQDTKARLAKALDPSAENRAARSDN